MTSSSLPEPSDSTSVIDFYKGRNIFVTGFTGFMGKVLVEKLLWSCEGIGNIYILVRPKKGGTPSKRLDEIFQSPVS
jgi:alcohol-forming fatty acyl-CoA reductase